MSNPWSTDESIFGLISDNCPDLVALIDVNGFFVYSNQAHFVGLGRSVESLVGVPLFELIHPEDAAEFERIVMGAVKRHTVFELSARWLREDHGSARFESLGKWILADGGRSQYLLLTSREVLSSGPDDDPGEIPADLRVAGTRLLARAEEEKNQVARVIHDDLGQKLTAMSLELSLWKTELDSGHSKSVNAIREKISVLANFVNGLIHSTRQVSSALRPRVLEEFGLAAALEWHLEKVQKKTGMACSFSVDCERLNVDAFVALQAFKVAEELIELRARAGSRSLHVRALAEDDAVALVFEDSGKHRQVTPEISARVRLLGGQIEISNAERSIIVALPARLGEPSLD